MTPEEIPADVYGYARRAFIKAFDSTGRYISLDDINATLRPALATAITQLFSGAETTESGPCCERHHPGDLDAVLHAERLAGQAEGHAAGVKEATARAEAAWTALRRKLEYQFRLQVADELYSARSWHQGNAAWIQDMDQASQIARKGLWRYAADNRLPYPFYMSEEEHRDLGEAMERGSKGAFLDQIREDEDYRRLAKVVAEQGLLPEVIAELLDEQGMSEPGPGLPETPEDGL